MFLLRGKYDYYMMRNEWCMIYIITIIKKNKKTNQYNDICMTMYVYITMCI